MTSGLTGYRSLAQLGAGPMVATPPPLGAPAPPTPASTLPPPITPIAPPLRPAPAVYDPASLGTFGPPDPTHGATPQGSGNWRVPMLPITLPTPMRLLRDGSDLLTYHPRDPRLRATGERAKEPAAPAPKVDPAEPPRPDGSDAPAQAEGTKRSGAARVAMMVGIGGGFAQNAIDIARTVKKYPEALRAGTFEPSLGRLGRLPTAIGLTAMTRPDARIVDPAAPRVATMASAGKSFTRWDELAMKSSVLLGTSLAGIQLLSAVPNLADALGKDGPWYENLAMSTSGRAGVLQLAGGGVGLGLFAVALKQTKDIAGPGIVSKALAAGKAPVMAKPFWTKFGLATGAVVMANELGYFDMLNRGEQRRVGTVLADAAHKTPVLNDSSYRTAGLLTAGGVLGFKAHRAISAAGGLSGLGKGHLIGGAIVGGLLGAQLLGGLDVLNAD
ncbi:MAG: hypothetical protein JWM86_1622 [Thermoleophilia bacterium]|nr:hypothetical protein [Thermoleophilia bacterium]